MTATSLQDIDVAAPRRKWAKYVEYKSTVIQGLPKIPIAWAIISLKHALAIPITDGPHETPEKLLEGIPFVSAEAVKNGRLDFTKKWGFISQHDHERFSKKYHPQRGDVFMVKSGATTGNVACVETDEIFNIWSPLAVMRPHKERATTEFIYYFMQSEAFLFSVKLSWSYGTQQNIGMGVLSNLKIPLPPLDEQRAIAGFLDRETARIDALIAKKERLIELLKEKRQAAISRAVTKGLNPNAPMKPSGIDWLGDVPKHWKTRAFRYSARIVNGQVDPEHAAYRDLPLIAPNHIESGTGRLLDYGSAADQAAESGKYLFDPGNVLYSKIRPALAKVCIAPERGLCSADMYPITPSNDLHPLFLMYYMLSDEFTSGVVLLSSRVAMPKMNRRDLGGFAVLVPPIDEQDEIVKFILDELTKIDAARAVIEEAVSRLRQYRAALITAAVTGQIDVRKEVA